MGHMKNFDIRIRNGGDDAIAAVGEYVKELEGEVAAARACAEMMLQGTGQKLGEELARRVMDQRYPTKWIPVEERLPKIGDPVLTAWPQHDNVVSIAWTLSPTRWEDIEGFIDTPSHWQPLPEPPSDRT